ncbi:vWA domain-containing protein [Sediminibacterium soli]|uniref:vWA domain-containing protein n=1 Tax=Sediminibacterium soli TaxID=2698829 RepID=UPI001379C203|nr:VWA domain-containing protein [Sediminibacterium soli]NCI45711.1 VWA domain-containing protein [Sediminibacterium soli]
MKPLIWLLLCLLACNALWGQFYLRGEVRDNRGKLLGGVRINIASRGANPFFTGATGTFGIPLSAPADTIRFTLEGYETLKTVVDARRYQVFVLKMLSSTAQQYTAKLSSVTTNLKTNNNALFSSLGESYTNLIENGFVQATNYPETGFALHIDKASYSNIRRFLNNDMRIPKDAIRIEEMLNYFDFGRQNGVAAGGFFQCRTQLTTCPWNTVNSLFFINFNAPKLGIDSIPASNLVFLIDVSGSMDKPNRLPLLQSAFKLLIGNLREKDTISIVTYGGGVGIALGATSGKEKQRIRDIIDSLYASGDTPGSGAITTAYSLARRSFIPNGNNRVILATDGDFNVGQSTERELEDMIAGFRQTGIYLTCLGVGMGNYKDSKLETLAKKGNGNFAYIDNQSEAEKVLVTELTQTLYAVANNAFARVNFDPSVVNKYRLIGFDNKKNAAADSSGELEGGEVGSGHTAMAVFEIEPKSGDAGLLNKHFADIRLQYKLPGADRNTQQLFTADYHPVAIEKADSSYRFAASIALFGSLLKQSPYVKGKRFEDLRALANTAVNPMSKGQLEFLMLIDKAAHIYQPEKRRVKKKKEEE